MKVLRIITLALLGAAAPVLAQPAAWALLGYKTVGRGSDHDVITVDPGGIPALVDFLDARYALVESDTNLRIYDLTRPLQPGIPSATANPALAAP